MRLLKYAALLILFVLTMGITTAQAKNPCKDVPMTLNGFTVAILTGARTPCSMLVTVENQGDYWAIEGSSTTPLTILATNANCLILRSPRLGASDRFQWTPAGIVYALKPNCRFRLKLLNKPHDTYWRFYIHRVNGWQ